MASITLTREIKENSNSLIILLSKGRGQSLTDFVLRKFITDTEERRRTSRPTLIAEKPIKTGTEGLPVMGNSRIEAPREIDINQGRLVGKNKSVFGSVKGRKMKSRKDSGVAQPSRKNSSTRSAMFSQSRRENDIINSSSRENASAVRLESGKASRGFDGQRSEKRIFRIEAMRKLSNGTIEVTTNGNFTMPVVEHEPMQILPKSRAFISLRNINSDKIDPLTLKMYGNGKNKAFIDPRKKKVRKRTIPKRKEIGNKKGNPRVSWISLKLLAVKASRRTRTERQMKASLRGLTRGHRGL